MKRQTDRAVYKMRQAIVELVFGQIKEQRGLRRFNRRGKQNVNREEKLMFAVRNPLKLLRPGWASEMELTAGKGCQVTRNNPKVSR